MSLAALQGCCGKYAFSTARNIVPWAISVGELWRGAERRNLDILLKKEAKIQVRDKDNRDFFSSNGILLAVPKKKVSHQKKRQKLYGPGSKQLKMIHHVNRCPSCGHFKLANALCTHCVEQVSHIWRSQTAKPQNEPSQERELSQLDKRVLYPGKKDTEYVKKLKDKESYLERPMRALPVEDDN